MLNVENKHLHLTTQVKRFITELVMNIVNDLKKKSIKKRIVSIDFARGIALIFVILVHTLDQLCSTEVQDSIFGFVIVLIGRLIGSVVFMFLMGISMVISRRSNLKKGVRRGFQVILIGYILNFLRGTMPVWVGLKTGAVTLAEIDIYTPLFLFKEIDILHFAGLGLIILSLVKNYITKPVFWVLGGLAIVFSSPFLRGLDTGLPFVDYLLDFVWGKNDYVHFSLFPWLAYPLFGMAYGTLMVNAKNKMKFFFGFAVFGLLLMIPFTFALINNPDYETIPLHLALHFFRETIPGAFWYSGFVFVWMAFCYWLIETIPSPSIFNRLFHWSKNITIFFCVQWVIIGWASIYFGSLNFLQTIVAMLSLLFLTDRVLYLWNKNIQIYKKKEIKPS